MASDFECISVARDSETALIILVIDYWQAELPVTDRSENFSLTVQLRAQAQCYPTALGPRKL